MKNKIIYGITVGVIGVMLAGAQTAMSAAAWMLPETGLQMESQAKQAYVAKEMGKFFHPQPGDAKPAPVKFEVPDGWIYRTFTVDGLNFDIFYQTSQESPASISGRGSILPCQEFLYR